MENTVVLFVSLKGSEKRRNSLTTRTYIGVRVGQQLVLRDGRNAIPDPNLKHYVKVDSSEPTAFQQVANVDYMDLDVNGLQDPRLESFFPTFEEMEMLETASQQVGPGYW